MRHLGDSSTREQPHPNLPLGRQKGKGLSPRSAERKKAGNTKRLNGTKEEINPSLALPLEDIRGGNKN
jgi:hypothetical protein